MVIGRVSVLTRLIFLEENGVYGWTRVTTLVERGLLDYCLSNIQTAKKSQNSRKDVEILV